MDITKNKLSQVKYPAMAETKMDGEYVKWDGNRLINDYGTDRTAWIDTSPLPQDITLLGELYYGEGKEYYSELHSHRGVDNKVVWFDIGKNIPYSIRRRELVLATQNYVQGEVVHCKADVEQVFADVVVAEGYEGIVVKPLDSIGTTNWVKLKREYTCNLYVRGIRKKTSGYGGSKRSIAVGTKDHIYGCCSVIGWMFLIEMIVSEKIISEDKDFWFIQPKIIVEVGYSSLLYTKKLRSPRIKRIRDYREEVKEL